MKGVLVVWRKLRWKTFEVCLSVRVQSQQTNPDPRAGFSAFLFFSLLIRVWLLVWYQKHVVTITSSLKTLNRANSESKVWPNRWTGPDLWSSDDWARRAVVLQAGAAASAVQWFMFFLSDRSFYVSIVDLTSTSAALPWRDHKAPVLELILVCSLSSLYDVSNTAMHFLSEAHITASSQSISKSFYLFLRLFSAHLKRTRLFSSRSSSFVQVWTQWCGPRSVRDSSSQPYQSQFCVLQQLFQVYKVGSLLGPE